jgi:hypothetical protein
MSTPNVPEVQIITDDSWKTVVKVLGFFNAATSSNTVVVQANTLFGANNSANAPLPILSVARVLYSQGLANGFLQLEWVGKNGAAANNSDIINLGARTSGDMPMTIPNALALSNTSNVALANTTGDINLSIVGAEPNDAFSIFITLNKENSQGGWANAFIQYNASDFRLA